MPDDAMHWDWTCGTGHRVSWYRASPTELADAWATYAEWRARWYQSAPEPITEVHGSGAEMFAQLEPGDACWIFAETNSKWTAVMPGQAGPGSAVSDLVPCSLADIESGQSAGGKVSRLFRVRGQPTRYMMVEDVDRVDRIVSCDKETQRWAFRVSGEPFEFEETDRYLVRDRGQRLTTNMLRRYADALGIPLGEDEVLTGNGLYIREVPFYWENCLDLKAASLEIAQMCQSRLDL